MIARTTRIASLALLTALVGIPATSQAAHSSYAFGGRQVGCGGEVHMIRALQFVDQAFATLHYDPHHRAALAAHAEVDAAEREVKSPHAGQKLAAACASLSRFTATHCPDDLARAGRLIQRALELEQQYHLACHSHAVRPVYPVYGGHGYGYSQPQRSFGLSVQGRHGGVSFRFSR